MDPFGQLFTPERSDVKRNIAQISQVATRLPRRCPEGEIQPFHLAKWLHRLQLLTGKDIGDHIYSAFFGKPGESQRNRIVAKSVELPDSSMVASVASLTKFEPAEAMESAFGDFDDDGGFSVAERPSKVAQLLALRSTSSATLAALSALNSYEQNVDLDESKEPFRFRFPA
jgi:hypothetical protein